MRARALPILAFVVLLLPLAAAPAGSAALCFGRVPTIQASPGTATVGTPGSDVIRGTAGADVIQGGGGNDFICGLEGADVLLGNAGRDRLDGGPGRDLLRGGPGTGNLLLGGPGNDRLFATSPSDTARGGGGNDVIEATSSSFSVLRGGDGSDTIYSGYRSDLDAGAQEDHCGLGLAVAGTGCETVELLCGSGGAALPPMMVNLTTAPGDFDGNGGQDVLYVWGLGATWQAQVQTDGGYGARAVLPAMEQARAVGGHDVDGDGVDEAFVVVDSGAYTRIVGLYTLYEPVGSPATGFSCGLEPVTFSGGARAEFAVGASVGQAGGLACRPDGTLREIQQETTDGTHYTQHRWDYGYLPGFGIAPPHLGVPTPSTLLLTWPDDQAAIEQAGQLTCGSLDL